MIVWNDVIILAKNKQTNKQTNKNKQKHLNRGKLLFPFMQIIYFCLEWTEFLFH